jgi:hypothetical protein
VALFSFGELPAACVVCTCSKVLLCICRGATWRHLTPAYATSSCRACDMLAMYDDVAVWPLVDRGCCCACALQSTWTPPPAKQPRSRPSSLRRPSRYDFEVHKPKEWVSRGRLVNGIT